jgi:carbamoyltransferase
MLILGINAYFHDSSIAIIRDGQILIALEQERISRKKHDDSFPIDALMEGLDYLSLTVSEFDFIVYHELPYLKFERILENLFQFAPRGFSAFLKYMPSIVDHKLLMESTIYRQLKPLGFKRKDKNKILFVPHSVSHHSAAYFTSGFKDSTLVSIDAMGEKSSIAIGKAVISEIVQLKEIEYPHSIGLFYSAFTYFLGFKVNSGEYKLMGLAPYGDIRSDLCSGYINTIESNLLHIHPDGSFALNLDYFSYTTKLEMIPETKWEILFCLKRREDSDEIRFEHLQLAFAVQTITEKLVLGVIKYAYQLHPSENLCLSGGVAYNCVANGKIASLGLFKNIHLFPATGDAGNAVGAALFVANQLAVINNEKQIKADYGRQFSAEAILNLLNAEFPLLKNESFEKDELIRQLSNELNEGKIIGLFQGREEFGPRSLGFRSILANPLIEGMQQKINLKIKGREGFRPFAPVVLKEDAELYFVNITDSPYMLMTYQLKPDLFFNNLDKIDKSSIKTQLDNKRSEFDSVVHVDGSSRVQTLERDFNSFLHDLITEFKKISGIGMLINTSFNRRGEPIVHTPKDAVECFLESNLDVLVLENIMIKKSENPHLNVHEFPIINHLD